MKTKMKDKVSYQPDSDELNFNENNNNGFIPISVFMSAKTQLHFNDLDALARKFMAEFVGNTTKISRQRESFISFLRRCCQATITELGLPIEASIEIQDNNSIKVQLNPSDLISSGIPSVMLH